MLTQAQYQRLPPLMREIVDADRKIAARIGRVITLAEAREIRVMIGTRRTLTATADRIWRASEHGGGAK